MIFRVKMGVMKINIGLLYWLLNCVNFYIFGFVVCLFKYWIVMFYVFFCVVVLCFSIGGWLFVIVVINLKKRKNDIDF